MEINYHFNEIMLMNLNFNLNIWTTISFEKPFKKGNYTMFSYQNKNYEFIVSVNYDN